MEPSKLFSQLQEAANPSTRYSDFLIKVAILSGHTYSREDLSSHTALLKSIRDKILPQEEKSVESKSEIIELSSTAQKRKFSEVSEESFSNKKLKVDPISPEILFLLAVSSPQLYDKYKKAPNNLEVFNDKEMNPSLQRKLIKFLRGEETAFGEQLVPALYLAKRYKLIDLEICCQKKIDELMNTCAKMNNVSTLANTLKFSSGGICYKLEDEFISTLTSKLDASWNESRPDKIRFWSLFLFEVILPRPFIIDLLKNLETETKVEASEGKKFLGSLLRLKLAHIKLNHLAPNAFSISSFKTIVDDTEGFSNNRLNLIIEPSTSFDDSIHDLEQLVQKLDCPSLTFKGKTEGTELRFTQKMGEWTQKLMPKFEMVTFVDFEWTDTMIECFKISGESKLENLTIDKSDFKDEQLIKLFEHLQLHPKIKKFRFSENRTKQIEENFSEKLQTHFTKFLNQCSLSLLNLDQSPDMISVIPSLFENEKINASISNLSLYKIGNLNPYADHFSKFLKAAEKLSSLNIGAVTLSSDNIQKFIKNVYHVNGLDLSGLPIDNSCAQEIGNLCNESEYLSELNLRDTGLKNSYLHLILNGTNGVLLDHLDLSGNPFTNNALKLIQTFLSTKDSEDSFPGITNIDLQNIKMSSADLRDFSKAIKDNDKLATLIVSTPVLEKSTPLKNQIFYQQIEIIPDDESPLDERIEIIPSDNAKVELKIGPNFNDIIGGISDSNSSSDSDFSSKDEEPFTF